MDEMNITENELTALNGDSETNEEPSKISESENAPENSDSEISEEADSDEGVDYESLILSDLEELKALFPSLSDITDILELDNPLRYAELRDLGLSAREAYLATRKDVRRDNRSHLFGAAPRGASSPVGSLSEKELASARELFSDMSDDDIRKLYRKVTK